MEAIVQVVSAHDPTTELRTLRTALLFEEDLRGRVEFRTSPQGAAGLPASGETLVVALGAQGVGTALARGLETWIQHRDPRIRLRVTVDIAPGQMHAAAQDLAALMEPTANEASTPVALEPSGVDVTAQELIKRIENSIFSKPSVGRRGYDEDDVDAFLDAIIASLRAGTPMDAASVGGVSFRKPPFGKRGYNEVDVDNLLDEVQRELRKLRA